MCYAVVYQSDKPNCELFATKEDLILFFSEPSNRHFYMYFRNTKIFQLIGSMQTIDVTHAIFQEIESIH